MADMGALRNASLAAVIATALTATPSGAPPAAMSPFCGEPPEHWAALCQDASREAAQAVALVRLRGDLNPSDAAARSAVEAAERKTLEAARACAGAERWGEAAHLVDLAGATAGERVRVGMGVVLNAEIDEAQCSAPLSAERREEIEAFQAYVGVARGAGAAAARPSECRGERLSATKALMTVAERRCAWFAAAGGARAAKGAAALQAGDETGALTNLSRALTAFDAAQSACPGQARADVMSVRRAIADAVEAARGERPELGEAPEVRLATLEERGRGLAELLRAEKAREDLALFEHARCEAITVAGDETLGLAYGARGLSGERDGSGPDFMSEIPGGEDARDQAETLSFVGVDPLAEKEEFGGARPPDPFGQ